MDTSLIGLFCIVDDFCQVFLPHWKASLLEHQDKQRNKPSRMSTSEIMTIMIYFHQSHYRNFKHYYQREVQGHLKKYFPKAVSYNRFVELMPTILLPLCFLLPLKEKHLRESILLIQSYYESVIINAVIKIESLKDWLKNVVQRWAGSMALSFI
ncbi:hypothetical protein Psal005_01921 [Piscirickettsia salmonis]|nr:hypothetical protein Psal005_01921 [Piscirickettsia salmonis]